MAYLPTPFLICILWLIQPINIYSQDFNQIDFELIKLPEQINSPFEESKPLISPGGDSLFFIRSYYPENMGGESAGQDIWFSQKLNNVWSVPANNLNGLNNDDSNLIIGFTSNQKIYTLKYSYENGTRYATVCISRLIGCHWSESTPIDLKSINVGEGYHDFYVHPSEKVILISMLNIDSIGEEDIYVIFKDESKEWIGPLNLGSKINTRGFEISPFLSDDFQTLYFSTDGRDGYGNADVWRSERKSDNWLDWSEPTHLGDPVNSSGFDAYFSIHKDQIYFVSNRNSVKSDIFQVKKREKQIQTEIPVEESFPELLSISIYFDFDQFKLTSSAEKTIKEFCMEFSETEIDHIQIEGFTDPLGSDKYNIKLSTKRAYETKKYLKKAGFRDTQIIANGLGVMPENNVEEEKMRQVKIMVNLRNKIP